MRYNNLRFAIVLACLSIFTSCVGGSNSSNDSELTVNQRYPMPWVDANKDEFVKIGRTLVKNNITGCGEYYIRRSSTDNGECLVACSSDGENWLYYMVWFNTESVMGPYSDNSISKPY